MRIVKTYETLKQAERYQNRLYSKYSTVRLVGWPRFTEAGRYIWEVAE
jgi:hypothetical protein